MVILLYLTFEKATTVWLFRGLKTAIQIPPLTNHSDASSFITIVVFCKSQVCWAVLAHAFNLTAWEAEAGRSLLIFCPGWCTEQVPRQSKTKHKKKTNKWTKKPSLRRQSIHETSCRVKFDLYIDLLTRILTVI